MSELLELLSLAPVQRGLAATLIAGAGLPIVGVWIIGLDVVPLRFAMMHVALLGVALGSLMGVEPIGVALLLCAVSGAALAPLASRPEGLSGPLGLLMTLSIALALLVLSMAGVNATRAFEWLWGSVLATQMIDLVLLGVVAVCLAGFQWRFHSSLRLLLHDRELALCSGVPAGALTVCLLMLMSVAVAASIKLTGALLVDAVTLLPALAARNLGRSFGSILGWAVGIGTTGSVLGFFITLWADLPPGPILILTMAIITLASYANRGLAGSRS
jgi:zinc transport system permease protein